MKNKIFKIILFCSVFVGCSIISSANSKYRLFINGEKIDTTIIVQDGTTYVPIRLVSEKLGAEVGFTSGDITIINNSQAAANEDTNSDVDNNFGGGLVEDTIETLTDSEKQLIKDAKEFLEEVIEIKNGVVYNIDEETGKKTAGLSVQAYSEIVESKKESIENIKKYAWAYE